MSFYRRQNIKIWLVIIVVVCINSFLAYFSFAKASQTGERLFSLNVKKELMSEVLSKLAYESGYSISTSDNVSNLPVSVTFNNLTLCECLRRVVGNHSCFTVFDDVNRTISLNIIDSDMSQSSGSTRNLFHSKNDFELPDENDTRAILLSEAEVLNSLPQHDPMDDELVPPDTPGGKSITVREAEKIRSSLPQSDPLDNEVVPPDTPGGKSITVREAEKIRSSLPQPDAMDEFLVPLGLN